MRCPRCNAQLTDNASFCGVCGTPLSAPQGNVPDARPSLNVPGNDEATVAAPWAHGQAARGAQGGSPPPFANQPPPVPPAADWPGGQSGPPQAPQAGWSGPSQAPQANWMPESVNHPQFGAAPEMRPGSLNRSAVASSLPVRKRRRAGRIWARFLLILVLLAAILAGAWFFGVRPYLHNRAQTELEQALDAPESQVELAMLALPPGSQTIRGSESSMNLYLSSHDADPVQNLRMAITPTGLSLSFSTYGQNSTITALPVVSNGQLQVTNVQVQGVLALIMSNDELTSELNTNLQSFSSQLTHKITKLTLLEHEIDVQFG
ncbi:MAG TPA: zinc ribbon domain-containing protein [Ktedonobacteraceae bacterium]|nr:zinc ribbon domain-containing protein [Ktedonobacteraceae bacterium]